MADYAGGEADYIDDDDINAVIKMAIESAFKDAFYSPTKTAQQANTLIDLCLKNFQQQGKNYKWAVTCVVMQKTGAGLVTCCGMYWDANKDVRCRIAWENAHINVVVTVYAMAIAPGEPEEADF